MASCGAEARGLRLLSSTFFPLLKVVQVSMYPAADNYRRWCSLLRQNKERAPSHFRPLFLSEIPMKLSGWVNCFFTKATGQKTHPLFCVALSKVCQFSFSSVHRHKHTSTMDRATVCLFCLFGRVSYSGCSQFGRVYLQRFVRVRECYK